MFSSPLPFRISSSSPVEPGTCDNQKTAFSRTSWLGSFFATSMRMLAVSGVLFCEIRKTAFSRSPAEHASRRAITFFRIGIARSASI